jgi:hypothetical protein
MLTLVWRCPNVIGSCVIPNMNVIGCPVGQLVAVILSYEFEIARLKGELPKTLGLGAAS